MTLQPQSSRYLTSSQVGELYQVSARTVERWALEDPTMPATRVGRTLRFEQAALQRWLERRTQGSRKGRPATGQVAVVEGERA